MEIKIGKATAELLAALGAEKWPVWECGVSSFDWTYSDSETCWVLEGRVSVSCEGGSVSFGAGDLVRFPRGLSCRWQVSAPVRKKYFFGDTGVSL